MASNNGELIPLPGLKGQREEAVNRARTYVEACSHCILRPGRKGPGE